MIGSETSMLRFPHSCGQDQGSLMLDDHDTSRDKNWSAVQFDISHNTSQSCSSTI